MKEKGIYRSGSRKDAKDRVLVHEYTDHLGNRITNEKTIDRCNKLVIPPAWTDVWISKDPKSHLQAKGTDAKGRIQYIYHAEWTKKRAEEKFNGMTGFAGILPLIRNHIDRDLQQEGMPKDKVVALVIRLMDLYHIRVGNDEYARKNQSYGLTTLKEGHIRFDRSEHAEGALDAVFEFTGKSGKLWKRRIWEDDLALLIEASGKVGGKSRHQDLFRYEDGNGRDFDIKSAHINEYLDRVCSKKKKVTAKDFRTWAATWKAASRLASQLDPDTKTGRKRVLNSVIRTVAEDLGNTPSVCRSSYIHPDILSDWESGDFRERWNRNENVKKIRGLSREETITYHYLL